jgi:hypothetical protein
MKGKLIVVLLFVFALTPALAFAQNIGVEWNRWDAQINVPANGSQMQVVETQEVHVTNGAVRHGTRSWTSAVQVQSVYLVTGNNGNPQQLTQDNTNQPNTYSLGQSNGETTLEYTLPTPQSSGSSYVVQINYTAAMPSSGLVDWKVVPANHDFPVNSSTVTIHFPAGQAPDSSLVRVAQGNGTARINGNDVVIQSQGPIPAGQSFAIQVPFGAGVGAAGQSGNNSGNTNPVNPVNPATGQPTDTGGFQLPGIGTILLVVCVVGFLLLWGGGSLLRRLLGGLGGGTRNTYGRGYSGNGPQMGGNSFSGDNEPQGGEIQRGFRPSSGGQDRQLPNIGNDKDSGGSAGFS